MDAPEYPVGWVEKPKLDLTAEQLLEMSDEEFKLYENLVATYRQSRSKNPLADMYVNSERHHEFMAAVEFIVAAFGGNQSGKTYATVMLVVINCVPLEWVPPHLRQYRKFQFDRPFAARMCVPTLDKHAIQIALPYFKMMVPEATLEGGSWEKGWNSKSYQITFKNGSHVQFRSYQQDVQDHAGPALDAVFFDEQPSKALYEENLRRLTTKDEGFIRFALTPVDLSWVFHEIYQNRHGNPRIRVVEMSSYDNPYASRATIANIVATSTSKEQIQARLYGKFMAMEGRVYESFKNSPKSEGGHIVPNLVPSDMRGFENGGVIIAIDPEVRRPSAVFLRVDHSRHEVIQFDEYLPKLPGMNVKVFCEGLLEVVREWGIQNPEYIIDPIAVASDPNTGQSIIAHFSKNGIFPRPGTNAKELGYARVNGLIQAGEFFMCERCLRTRDEMDIFAWDAAAAERGESKAKKTKYAPNALDSLRYGCMAVPWEPETKHKRNPPPPGSTLEWIGKEAGAKTSEYIFG